MCEPLCRAHPILAGQTLLNSLPLRICIDTSLSPWAVSDTTALLGERRLSDETCKLCLETERVNRACKSNVKIVRVNRARQARVYAERVKRARN